MTENREIQWVVKSYHPLYPKEYPPFQIYIDEFIQIKQEESMSGDYPEASWLLEYELVDYQGTIIIPWLDGKVFAGFEFFPTKKWAKNHIKEHHHLFPKVIEKYPELII